MKQSYSLDNALAESRQRLALLQASLDPGSIRHLEALGVGDGWKCAEVGDGAGSMTQWLCRRVGCTGYVLATDVDTRFLDELEHPNLEVGRHDITAEPLPKAHSIWCMPVRCCSTCLIAMLHFGIWSGH